MSGRQKESPIDQFKYSTHAHKVLVLGADGTTYATPENALPMEDTYQDVPFNDSKSITVVGTVEQLVTNVKKGWITITADPDNTGTMYVGNTSVTSANGYKLNSDNPCITLSIENLSLWFFDADNTTDKLMIIGAYVN
jgi:hypothetical protein